ncbi:hypothetical protein [Streptomyces wuyuanensis]|uniref:hypothetical protein n=1 Tax=Streptomyces wuyuanensis TaxID=1196353 RepID=UPI003414A239
MFTFVTFEELTGRHVKLDAIEKILRRTNLSQVLRFAAHWLSRSENVTKSQRKVDSEYVACHFRGDWAPAAKSLLASGRVFVAPQLFHVLMKLALLVSPPDGALLSADTAAFLILALGDHVGGRVSDASPNEALHLDGVPGALARELISNQHFNYPQDPALAMAMYTRRWREIPLEDPHPELGSVDELYHTSVGVSFDEMELVVVGLWAHVMSNNEPLVRRHPLFNKFPIQPERLDRVMQLISRNVPQMRRAILEDMQQLGGGFDWSVAPFERTPIVQLPGGYLVMDPRLLAARIFGWLPYWDIASALRAEGKNREVGQFRDYSGRISERYAMEVLQSASSGHLDRRLFFECDLIAAYGRKRKVVDAVIDYGDSWVVLDISTRQLVRESVAGTSGERLKGDFEALVGRKAKQLAATISALREDESKLTGVRGPIARKFLPVIVASEGFPVNPAVSVIIEDLLVREGLLQEADIAPLQVIDTTELEMVEALEESGASNFSILLQGKVRASLHRSSLRDYILIERRLRPGRSSRISGIWRKPFDRVLDAMRPIWEEERKLRET